MTILNWGSSVGDRTIDTGGVFLVPETEAQRFARTGEALPANLVGKNDFGLGFVFTVDPASGEGTYVLDPNGLKISSGSVRYSAADADDFLQAVGYPPGVLSSGIYLNALDLTTIRMGDGDDRFSVIGQGITQSIRADVNIDASQGYIFQSSIFAGGGDDRVSVLMPWQSVFKGGANTTYYDAVFGADPGGGIGITLSDDLTLEEVEYGDLIVLKGSRFDWDIEFKDGDGDGVVTLDSILDERDFLAVSNNNQISGFERILFGDILFDLVLYRQQESSAVFGQPDYYLNGLEALAPELNSDITSGSELWEAFRFNRTKLQGITGTATDQTDVFTGDANDTPFLVGALRFASLNTEAGNDIVEIGTPGQAAVEDASIDLGEGNDQLKVNGLFTRSSVIGGAGADNIILSTITNSSVDGGIGNDVVQVTTSTSQTRFDGGEGNDVLLLPDTFGSYQLTSSNEAGIVTFNDGFGNSITGFETIRFSDINLDALQTLSLSGPPTSVNEGANASYTIALSNSGLASGDSVAFSLQLGDDTAQFSTDLAALVPGSLQAAAGIVLSNVGVDAATGLIQAVASASRGFNPGATIATLNLPVAVDLQNEPDETFTVTLTDFVQAQPPVSTTIRNVLPVTIRLSGPASVTEGQAASYLVALDGVGLAAGRSVTFSLDSAGGSATEGVDFAALLASSLEKADGITLGSISTAANGTVTVTATNTSGAALAVGATLLTVQLPTTTDALVEGSETFGVTLSSSTAVVSSGVVTTTINDLVPTPTIALSGQASVAEGQSAHYAVSLGGSGLLAGQSVTFTLDSASGTALEGVDFAALTAGAITAGAGVALSPITTDPVTKALTVTATNTSGGTLAAGAQLLSFSIATTADLFNEGPETFGVSLTSTNATVNSGSLTTTITDNDPLAVRISGPASVAEGSSTTPYTIALGSGVGLGADRSVTFSIDSASGSATEGVDFAALTDAALTAAPGIDLALISTAANGTITLTATNSSGADLAAGSALLSFAIGTTSDLISEANESFSLNLAGATGVSVQGAASVVTTISDDDAPALRLTGSTSVAEGAAASYALALDGVGLGAGRSVSFTLDSASGTATAGSDFAVLTAGSLQPVAGVTLENVSTDTFGFISGTATNTGSVDLSVNADLFRFSIATAADAEAELAETYNVEIFNSNAFVREKTFTTTITDDSLPVIRLTGPPAVAEGSSAIFGVSLAGGVALGAGRSITLTLDSASGTAKEGLDFAALTAADLSPGLGITLSPITTDPVTKALTFTATNTLGLTLAAGSQLLSFELPTTADLFSEGPETFELSLTSTNATVSTGSITTTINDDDAVAIKLTGSADVAEGATANYVVSLDGVGLGAGRSLTFSIDSASGTATEGLDFAALVAAGLAAGPGINLDLHSTAADGRLTLTATNTSGADLAPDAALVSFSIATAADAVVEGNEIFVVNLASTTTSVSTPSVVTTISDDDAPALKLTGDPAVAEGAAASYALALDGVGLGAGRSVTFTLDSASGTATEGVDFAALTAGALSAATGITLSSISTAANGAITATATNTSSADLAAGFEILSFSLAVNADSIAEGSESYSVSLSGANGSGTVSTTISDGDAAVIRLDGSASVLEGANAHYTVTLDGVGLGAGQSVTFTLDSASGTALEGVDFAALTAGAITAGAGVVLSGISTDPVTKAVTLTATNSGGGSLAAGSQLVSFSVAATSDAVAETNETFGVTLTTPASGAAVSNASVSTTIGNVNGLINRSTTQGADVLTPAQWLELNGEIPGAPPFAGIAGSEKNPITVQTGDANNRVILSDAIAFATLDTGDGDDLVQVIFPEPRDSVTPFVQFGHGAYGAEIRTGAGNDVINIQSSDNSEYVRSSSQDLPSYDLSDYYDSIVDAGSGNDFVYGFLPYKTQFFGGDGLDTLFLYGRFRDWSVQTVDVAGDGFELNDASSDYTIWDAATSLSNTAIENTVQGFEFVQFNDINLDLTEQLTLTPAAPSVSEGSTASYAIALAGNGLQSGQSVSFTLQLRDGSARFADDLAALTRSSLQGASGIALEVLEVDAAAGLIRAVASATRSFSTGATIATLALPVRADLLAEPDETFDLTLGGFIEPQTVTTTILNQDQPAVRLSGPTSVLEGATTTLYTISLGSGVGLGAGASVSFSIDSASGTATEVVDFAALVAAGLSAASGIGLVTSTAGDGSITVTATNNSGADLAAGSQLVSFSVATSSDEVTEGDEAFRVRLASESATVTSAEVETTIRDLVVSGGDGDSGSTGGSGGSSGGGGGDSGGGDGSGEPSPTPSPRRKVSGTDGADEITGNSRNNVIYGGKGADLMTGGGGSNTYRFKLRDGLDQGDVITDFRPGSDRIRVVGVSRKSLAAEAFGGGKRLKRGRAGSAFNVVEDLGSSDRSRAVFLYSELTGELAYNANGSGRGVGRGGGVIATLPVLLPFRAQDIQVVYGS